jgi:LAO/AO transport system kinase
VVGLTGSPGAGKSTLVSRLVGHFKEARPRVGVLAVDPSSPFTGGAVLGDRIRMQEHFADPRVFIRSLATRGRLGGLSGAVQDGLLVLEAAGCRTLIVETVGVGQDEVEIARTAQVTVVALVPGMGDEIQALKAGILEIADIFVLNKSDRPGHEEAERQILDLAASLEREDGWSPPLVRTVATRGEGLEELVRAIEECAAFLEGDGAGRRRRLLERHRLLEMLRERVLEEVVRRLPEATLDAYLEKVMTREMDPYTIVDRLTGLVGLEEHGHG